MTVINPKYPGSEAVDEVDHALDLLRVARLAICAHDAGPSNVSNEDMAAIGYVLVYAMDILKPVREMLNSQGAADMKAFRAAAGNA
ncbi:hypothetical protein EJ076_18530 [Mesorhizobium sp. M7D.F.Ca.US.005.01.1.1]|uniref:hypothetical protein n=1 Tax=Mesorhizobium sp. M7D.F.Ca.US.005.01.1.1 TaxID=2493678 RepID=UPI000F74C139|nr:hypothetical protein [Mesorhizobium sp. M7D.F.Ca.US.005.01.1.1]AZO42951.1 hypothetical protein EJ076_18530 [Mesorhizobium sp. M7D.F.Ca.US.005.01.1.1]